MHITLHTTDAIYNAESMSSEQSASTDTSRDTEARVSTSPSHTFSVAKWTNEDRTLGYCLDIPEGILHRESLGGRLELSARAFPSETGGLTSHGLILEFASTVHANGIEGGTTKSYSLDESDPTCANKLLLIDPGLEGHGVLNAFPPIVRRALADLGSGYDRPLFTQVYFTDTSQGEEFEGNDIALEIPGRGTNFQRYRKGSLRIVLTQDPPSSTLQVASMFHPPDSAVRRTYTTTAEDQLILARAMQAVEEVAERSGIWF